MNIQGNHSDGVASYRRSVYDKRHQRRSPATITSAHRRRSSLSEWPPLGIIEDGCVALFLGVQQTFAFHHRRTRERKGTSIQSPPPNEPTRSLSDTFLR